jgi:hypothetical protein
VNLTPAQQQALRAWHAAVEAAKPAKLLIEAEQAARKAACNALETLLPANEGTCAVELEGGWQIKRSISYTRKIDVKVVESLRAPLKALHQSLDKLVDWKPSLITKEYRELTAEARAIFDTCLTTTPGLPTLELVPPKVQP